MSHGFLIDMDGVVYRGSKPISGAERFISELRVRGAPFLFLTNNNLDPNCPTASGLRPGCGAIVAMLEAATGRRAFSVGKPSPVMMRAAPKQLGIEAARTTIIGDTMETAILSGAQLGYRTVLVLSGGTRRSDLSRYAYQPGKVISSVAELCEPAWLEWANAA